MVGGALDSGELWCGLIADGHHVHPAAIGIALRAKRQPGRIFLVTDAMSTVGSDQQTITLNGRTVWRRNGALELEDGTLAGSDLDMMSGVRYLVKPGRRRAGRGAAHGLDLSGGIPAGAPSSGASPPARAPIWSISATT